MTNSQKGTINLSWKAPVNTGGVNLLSFQLWKETVKNSGIFQLLYKGLNTSFSDTLLAVGSSYNYKIYCENIVGLSQASFVVTGNASQVPSAITTLTVSSVSQTTINITWLAPIDNGGSPIIKYYILSESTVSSYTSSPIDNGIANSYTYSVNILNVGQMFKFIVFSSNIIGNSSYSNEIVTYACNPPNAPTLTVGDRTKTSILLNFVPDANTGGCLIIGYKLSQDQGVLGSSFNLIYDGTNKPSITGFNVINLISNLNYQFNLVVYNKSGQNNGVTSSFLIGIIPSAFLL